MKNLIFRLFPWLIVLILAVYVYLLGKEPYQPNKEVITNTILSEIEAMGKLELVKYNFQEITELTQLSEEWLDFFKLDRDSKIVLISHGSATACVDLTTIEADDIVVDAQAIRITLSSPEICYYKLDLQKSRVYSLETGYFIDKERFIEEAYRSAEAQVEQAALASGILDQAEVMGRNLLGPMLSKITGKVVEIEFRENSALSIEPRM